MRKENGAMRCSPGRWCLVVTGTLVLCAAVVADDPATAPTTASTSRAVATRPATTPASRPAAKVKEPDPLRLAVQELQREAQTALQQKKPFPREKSDYFQPGNPIKPDALVKLLGGRLHQNPRIDAYVKLQLLSAVERFEGDLALEAVKAYVLGSPSMIALPGSTQQEQQKWTQKALAARQEDIDRINEEWNQALAPYVEANQIIIAYRDGMRARISPGDEFKQKYFQAVLEDLAQRGAAGFEVDKDLTAVSKTINAWAHLAKKSQLREMQSALKEYVARRPPKFYEKLTWRRSDKKADWTYHYAGLPVSKVEKIQEEVDKAMANALE